VLINNPLTPLAAVVTVSCSTQIKGYKCLADMAEVDLYIIGAEGRGVAEIIFI
jgi:hypothetical protein